MKTFTNRLAFILIITLSGFNGFGQLTVTSGLTPAQYVDFLIGSGITYSNVVYTGDPASVGKFLTGTTPTNLGLSSGIIMSSGFVTGTGTEAIGSPVGNDVSDSTLGNSDPDLLAMNPTCEVADVAKFDFDFIPVSDTVKFRYVFGSEEYLEFVGAGYNDVFGFYISGPNPAGGNYSSQNIALIPNTILPVAIDNVNDTSHSAYYIDNEGLNGTTIVFDGFTTVLTAWAIVTPCQQYHIKLAIGDVGDNSYDSGVFLEANSFSSSSVSMAVHYTNESVVGPFSIEGGCNDANICFSISSIQDTNVTVDYMVQGTATSNQDYPAIPQTLIIPAGTDSICLSICPIEDTVSEGTETIILILENHFACSSASDTAVIQIKEPNPIVVVTSPDTTICGSNIPIHATGTDGIPPYSYTWDHGLSSQSNLLVSPASETIYNVTVTDFCDFSATAEITVSIGTINVNLGPDVSICPDQGTLLSADSGQVFLWNTGETTQSIFATPSGDTQYSVLASTGLCTGSDTIMIFVLPNPVVTANISIDSICKGDTLLLSASGADHYLWTSSPTDLSLVQNQDSINNELEIRPNTSTTYTTTGYNYAGCTATSSVHVTVLSTPVASFFSQPPFATSFDPTIHFYDNSQGNPVFWHWELSDGTTYDIPEFIHQYPPDQSGEFPVMLYVENEIGCSDSITQMITIKPDYTLYIPNAISPNGDGINDRFHISGLNLPVKDFSFRVYDRWGALMFNSSVPSFEWDGFVDGKVVPDAVYSYRLVFSDPTGNVHVKEGSITVIY